MGLQKHSLSASGLFCGSVYVAKEVTMHDSMQGEESVWIHPGYNRGDGNEKGVTGMRFGRRRNP